MNYSELLDNVRNYTEVSNQVLTNAVINVFIINIEDQVAREVDSDSQRRYATATSVANNAFLDVSGPEGGFRFARGLQILNSSNERTWLQQRDATFMDEYANQRSETTGTGFPKFWGNWNGNTIILAPTPDAIYTIEMWYDETPERLSSTNTTTFLSTNAQEVLIYGCVAQAYSYLKNSQDMQIYDQKFQSAMTTYANEQMGRKRRDEYMDGVLRIPLRSVDPGGT
jgi:hypothetical protein